ncbi:MAG TPA: hypothetical protein VLA82_03145 [Actinomycetota bacterium]|nr:hypothetical protein [Actinomycetota bacterium]
MAATAEGPPSIGERVSKLEASRRRHMWVLILLVFTTCGYVEGRSTDVDQNDRVNVLRNEVRRLADEVASLQDAMAATQDPIDST